MHVRHGDLEFSFASWTRQIAFQEGPQSDKGSNQFTCVRLTDCLVMSEIDFVKGRTLRVRTSQPGI